MKKRGKTEMKVKGWRMFECNCRTVYARRRGVAGGGGKLRTLKVDDNTVLAAPRFLLADHNGGQH